MLEWLESRVLLAATWVGGATGNWSVSSNWEVDLGGGVVVNRIPLATDDVVVKNTATITVDKDFFTGKIAMAKSLEVQGSATEDVKLTLVADARAFLQISGLITLNQAGGHATDLNMAVDNAPTNNALAVIAQGLAVTGTNTGWSDVTVNQNNTLKLSQNFDSGNNVVNLTVNGTMYAANAYLKGKAIPDDPTPDPITGRVGDPSVVNISNGGHLKVYNELRIGSVGQVNLVFSGTSLTGVNKMFIYNDTSVSSSGTAMVLYSVLAVGTPAPAMAVAEAGVEDGPGAVVNIGAGSTIAGGSVRISGGDGIQINVSGSFGGTKGNLALGPANVDGVGPLIKVGAGGNVFGSAVRIGGGTFTQAAGRVLIQSGGSFSGDSINVNSSFYQSERELTVEAGGQLFAINLKMGNNVLDGSEFCHVLIGGSVVATGLVEIGDGLGSIGYVRIATGGTVTAPTVNKFTGGYVVGAGTLIGGGTLTGPGIRGFGTGADFIPGDYLRIDDDGDLATNPDSADSFGTLTHDGDLDASLGITLDSVIGEASGSSLPGDSSKLAVTGTDTESGTAILGGTLTITTKLPTDVYSTDYTAGTNFTLLTAEGGVFGQFSNLPEGYYDSSTWYSLGLPSLATGLEWHVDYGPNAVTLSVAAGPVLPNSGLITTSGITPATGRTDVGGGGYVSLEYGLLDDVDILSGFPGGQVAVGGYEHTSWGQTDYWDAPTGGTGYSEGGVTVYAQVIGDKLAVAMATQDTEGYDDRLVFFFAETDYTPGMTSTGALTNMLDGSTYTLGSSFTNGDFLSLMDSPTTPFIIAGTGGTITLDSLDYSAPVYTIYGGTFTASGSDINISRLTGDNSDIVEVQDADHVWDIDPTQTDPINIDTGSGGDTITFDETNGGIGFLDEPSGTTPIHIESTGSNTLIVSGGSMYINEYTGSDLTVEGASGGYLDIYNSVTLNGLTPDYTDGPGLAYHTILDLPGGTPKLTVDNDLALGGNLVISTNDDSTGYTASTAFTVVTATGALSGNFANLPEGTYTGNPYLPTLAAGLSWNVHYGAHDVVLTVVAHPSVVSIVRSSGSDQVTNADSVTYTVTFSEPVTGVDATDFELSAGGDISGASVTSVAGSGTTYTVTVATGTGDGDLALNLVDDDSITNSAGVALAGDNVEDGSFEGEAYTMVSTVYWDTSATAGLQGGSGTWSSGADNWNTEPDGSYKLSKADEQGASKLAA